MKRAAFPILLCTAICAAFAAACSPSDKPAAVAASAPAASAAAREMATLRAEVARLSAENERLRQTPAGIAAEVESAVKAGDARKAQAALRQLVDRYPGSAEINPSIQRVDSLVTRLRAQQDEERRAATLGFRALRTASNFSHGDAALAVRSGEVAKTWRYDSYGTGWKYMDAEKGRRFIVARATVTSQARDPALFGVAAYVAEGNSLRRIGVLRYRFARWQDFGSYLGTQPDYRNDFAHTSSVSFSLGVSASDEDLKQRPIYLVATRERCHTRHNERLAQPPVHYVPGACGTLTQALTVDDFKDGALAVVRRIE